MKRLLLSFLLLGVSLFVGCGGSSSSGGTTPPAVTLVSIAVTPSSPSITAGTTQQFSATGTYSDGSTKNLTSTANWLSATPAVATINVAGLATAVAVGTTTITATSGTITGTTVLTVTNPLVSITVTPATATVAPNGTQQFTAMGNYAFGPAQNITSSVTWSASPEASITSGGLATGLAPGKTATIMAAQGSISGTATLAITNPLVSIAVTPPTASIAAPFTESFTATGTYADNSTSVITSTVTWASSNTNFATISNIQGSQGVATGVAAGTTSITATLGSVTSPPATLTVTNATLKSIAVTPVTPVIVFQTQQQFMATGTFSDNSTHDITNSATWSSSDTTTITITPTGLATGVATTSSAVTITAKSGAVSGSTTATVIPPPVVSIEITPGTQSLAIGTSRQYAATATLANGSTLNVTYQALWTSLDPIIATVQQGLVNALSTAGPATIRVTYNGATQDLVVNVISATVNSLTVTPVAPTMPVGVTQRFRATAVFSDPPNPDFTQDITQDAAWTSMTPTVAIITSSVSGAATSKNVGTAVIQAAFPTNSNCSGSPQNCGTATITVDATTLSSIAIRPATTVLPAGKTINYDAYGTYSGGLTFYLNGLATWTSSNTSLVTIAQNGTAITQKPGPAVTISATYPPTNTGPYPQKTGTASVIVTQFPLLSIAVTPTTATVPVAVSTSFAAVGTFSDSSTQNLSSYATWAASPSSVATINTGLPLPGQATGLAPGQASITAGFAGVVSNNAAMTVSAAKIKSLAVTPNPASAKTGSQVQFVAVGTFDDGTTVDLTNQVNWTSSVVTVATINNSGVASVAGASGSTTVITATFTQDGTTVPGTTNLTVQ